MKRPDPWHSTTSTSNVVMPDFLQAFSLMHQAKGQGLKGWGERGTSTSTACSAGPEGAVLQLQSLAILVLVDTNGAWNKAFQRFCHCSGWHHPQWYQPTGHLSPGTAQASKTPPSLLVAELATESSDGGLLTVHLLLTSKHHGANAFRPAPPQRALF